MGRPEEARRSNPAGPLARLHDLPAHDDPRSRRSTATISLSPPSALTRSLTARLTLVGPRVEEPGPEVVQPLRAGPQRLSPLDASAALAFLPLHPSLPRSPLEMLLSLALVLPLLGLAHAIPSDPYSCPTVMPGYNVTAYAGPVDLKYCQQPKELGSQLDGCPNGTLYVSQTDPQAPYGQISEAVRAMCVVVRLRAPCHLRLSADDRLLFHPQAHRQLVGLHPRRTGRLPRRASVSNACPRCTDQSLTLPTRPTGRQHHEPATRPGHAPRAS